MYDVPESPASTADAPQSTTPTSSDGMSRWLVIGAVVFVVVSVVFIVLAVIYPGFREAVRDLAIILLALFQLIGAIAMALVAVALLYAVKAVDATARLTLMPKLEEISRKVDELLQKTTSVTDDVKKTSTTVANTVSIISEQIVRPAIQVSSFVSGIKAAAEVLGQRMTGTPSVQPKDGQHGKD
jgi:hypothetical protein